MSVRAVTATFPATGKSPHVRHSGRRREQQQLGHVWQRGQCTPQYVGVCGAYRKREASPRCSRFRRAHWHPPPSVARLLSTGPAAWLGSTHEPHGG